MTSKLNCGLVGRTLSHSISPLLHRKLGDENYRLFEVGEEELSDFLLSDEWDALNVTIPYKERAMDFCSTLSERAKNCGAVNVLVRTEDGILGDNTDVVGFTELCRGLDLHGKKVAVLGSGGACRAVLAACRAMGARESVVVSRSKKVRYEDTELYRDAEILVNTTPVGMYPDSDAVPIDLDTFEHLEAVIDIVANPIRTALCQKAEKRGILSRGGLRMLTAQAHEARRVFTGKEPPLTADELYRAALLETQSIAFIGMPGCGKSTFARLFGKTLCREVLDTDALIEKRAKASIPTLFETHGEAHFRALEREVIREVSSRQGVVLSVGGGAPLSEENRLCLRQNCLVVYLVCPTEELSREGRPLSTSRERLYEMAAEREAFYRETADLTFSFSKADGHAFEKLSDALRLHYETLL